MKGVWYEDLRRWQARYAARAVVLQTAVALEAVGAWLRLAAGLRYMAPEAVREGAVKLVELARQAERLAADLGGLPAQAAAETTGTPAGAESPSTSPAGEPVSAG